MAISNHQSQSSNSPSRSQMTFLFTSTASPYHDDTADLLELPTGLGYRFRYHERHLPSDVKEKIKQNNLPRNALLVHAITSKTEKPPNVLEYFPIRDAEIL